MSNEMIAILVVGAGLSGLMLGIIWVLVILLVWSEYRS